MIPEPNTHASGEKKKKLLGEALSAVREEIRDTETGLANPASVGRFRTPTGMLESTKFRPRRSRAR